MCGASKFSCNVQRELTTGRQAGSDGGGGVCMSCSVACETQIWEGKWHMTRNKIKTASSALSLCLSIAYLSHSISLSFSLSFFSLPPSGRALFLSSLRLLCKYYIYNKKDLIEDLFCRKEREIEHGQNIRAGVKILQKILWQLTGYFTQAFLFFYSTLRFETKVIITK